MPKTNLSPKFGRYRHASGQRVVSFVSAVRNVGILAASRGLYGTRPIMIRSSTSIHAIFSDSSFVSSFRPTGLRSQNINRMKQVHLSAGIYAKRTHDVEQGEAVVLIACSVLLHGLYITQVALAQHTKRPAGHMHYPAGATSTEVR